MVKIAMYKDQSYAQSEGLIPAGMTAGDYLAQAVAAVPDKPAILFNGQEITYLQLDDAVNQLAESLLNIGIRHGDSVALLLPNCPEFIIASQAILKIGAVKVPLNLNYREAILKFALLHSNARAIIMLSEIDDFSFVDLIARLRPLLPALEYVFVKGRTRADMIPLRQVLIGNNDAKNRVEKYVRDHPVDPDDIAAIVYSSGTTAKPKGVVHTHNTIYRLACASNNMRGVLEDEVWLGMLPLASAVGVMSLEPCPIVSRSTLVLPGSYSPEAVLNAFQQYKVTSPIGTPLSFIRIMKHPHFFDYDIASVRDLYFFGGAAPKEILVELQNKFNCTLTTTYGACEYGHATIAKLTPHHDNAYSTSGKPILGGVEVKIVNSNVQVVPRDQIGEIYVRSFGNALGYWGDVNRTDSTFCDSGWIHVHDLGFMDKDGNLTVIGRTEDIIVRGGYPVYPYEIESFLYTHPQVAEASIIGYPDPKLGEKICAFIIPQGGVTEITQAEIASFLRSKIAEYKIPDQVKLVAAFPVAINDKVQKFKLREMLTKEINDQVG